MSKAEISEAELDYGAAIAEPDDFAKVTGMAVGIDDPGSERVSIHPEFFDIVPSGARIVVALEPAQREYGMIQLPKSVIANSNQQAGAGWVLSAWPGRMILSSLPKA